jgi:hypothetical protein
LLQKLAEQLKGLARTCERQVFMNRQFIRSARARSGELLTTEPAQSLPASETIILQEVSPARISANT